MALVARTTVHVGGQYYNAGQRIPDDVIDKETIREFVTYGSAEFSDEFEDGIGESPRWRAFLKLEKYEQGDTEARAEDPDEGPDDVVYDEDNLLLIGGASLLWHRAEGGTTVLALANASAQLGVGDSTTAAADTQTDLQASTNKLFKAMDATYPQHSDSTGTSGSKATTARATFGTADANYAWNEWGWRNDGTQVRLVNRKVESLGTKTAGATWVLTVTLALA